MDLSHVGHIQSSQGRWLRKYEIKSYIIDKCCWKYVFILSWHGCLSKMKKKMSSALIIPLLHWLFSGSRYRLLLRNYCSCFCCCHQVSKFSHNSFSGILHDRCIFELIYAIHLHACIKRPNMQPLVYCLKLLKLLYVNVVL